MFLCIRGSYDDALYKSTYTLLYFVSGLHVNTRLMCQGGWYTLFTRSIRLSLKCHDH